MRPCVVSSTTWGNCSSAPAAELLDAVFVADSSPAAAEASGVSVSSPPQPERNVSEAPKHRARKERKYRIERLLRRDLPSYREISHAIFLIRPFCRNIDFSPCGWGRVFWLAPS
jgi:hypothetical protein